MFLRASPSSAPDPVWIDQKKVHTIIGPVTVKEPVKPGETKEVIEVRFMMDAGITHTIRYPTHAEALSVVDDFRRVKPT